MLGGSVAGGLVGNAVGHTTGDTTGFEYIVRKPTGDLLSVTQKDAAPLKIGQHVLIIEGPQARIVPDYTVAVDDAAHLAAPSAAKPPEAKAETGPTLATPAEVPHNSAVPSPPPPGGSPAPSVPPAPAAVPEPQPQASAQPHSPDHAGDAASAAPPSSN